MAEKKITEASVLALVEKNEITASKGAKLLDISIWDFYDLMYEHGVSLDDGVDVQELAKEFEEDRETLRALRKKHRLPKIKVGRATN